MGVVESSVVDRACTTPGDSSVPNAPFPTPTAAKSVSKSKSVEPESWDPAEFQRDATHFALTCGLPYEGLNPLNINDISDLMLTCVFGEKGRNGYKLNQCTGIPVSDLLELSQVVDGYDKPVNGVLSHSFVKGVYAERIQKRPVNWVAYASTKLRGQIAQWQRENKGKPEGPPCIREHRLYKPPCPEMVGNVFQSKVLERNEQRLLIDLSGGDASRDDFGVTDGASTFEEKVDSDRYHLISLAKKQSTNLLLAILRRSKSGTKACELVIHGDIARLELKLEGLKKSVLHASRFLQELERQFDMATETLNEVWKMIEAANADVESLTSDIELEGNKEDNDFQRDGHAEILLRNQSCLGGTPIVDLSDDNVESGSPKNALLAPKLELMEPVKKRKATKAESPPKKTKSAKIRG